MLGPQSRLLLGGVLPILRLLVEDVALVIPAGGRAVSRPLPEAQPAELVPAAARLGANHVVAALVLLDGLVALRALLGVRPDPTNVLRLGAILDIPLDHCLAAGRSMGLLPTSPAPTVVAVAANLKSLNSLILTSISAPNRVGAPLHCRIFVDICSQAPFPVLLVVLLVAEAFKEIPRHVPVALVLRTSSMNSRPTLIHLTVQVPCPAVLAETMPALLGYKLVDR
mmetsp:Transcript_59804/g.107615  ORF Transcript_59804/g.107615 Transcript_59804/m.107615 type:complete len:225 (-) Transcript_59804:579-1253(-)